jgi:imidazole glycerol-phosphate synthase subunit HisH
MNKKIVIVDYGIGNIYSVHQALLKSGAQNVNVSSDINDIRNCDSLILPGVGSFSAGMSGLVKKDLVDPIKEFAKSGKPLLGICLGAQMLLSESEEFGIHKGLNLIPGKVMQIPRSDNFNYRVPLIGWVDFDLNSNIPIFKNMGRCESFYFVHSFHCLPTLKTNNLLTFSVDKNEITALVSKDNIFGAQFHPEKSSKSGQQFLSNFINL